MIQITDRQNCTGCEACTQTCPQNCIHLKADNEGFLYPEVDTAVCINCGLCEKVCPVLNQGAERRPLEVMAAQNPHEDTRFRSSSGGVFSELALQILQDGGVVFGAAFDDDFSVHHIMAEDKNGLKALRGSKYTQSRIGDAYSQARTQLEAGRPVLFTGTPCQIAGLRRYLRKDYPGLLTVEVACHGVPSPAVWQRYLQEIKTDHSTSAAPAEIQHINFRSKRNGWKLFSMLIIGKVGDDKFEQCQDLRHDIFMRGFLKNLYLRPSCYVCPARSLKSGADLTIADYWGIQNVRPEADDDRGTSLVLVNTPRGNEIIEKLQLKSWPTTYDEALAGNHCLEQSVPIPAGRESFWRRFPTEGLSCVSSLTRTPLRRRILSRLRRLFK